MGWGGSSAKTDILAKPLPFFFTVCPLVALVKPPPMSVFVSSVPRAPGTDHQEVCAFARFLREHCAPMWQ